MNETEPLWVSFHEVPKGPSHPFYSRLERILKKYEFDAFCEKLCEPYYAEVMGRPSIPPGVYFRMLRIGYFERIASERGIAWKAADSNSLEGFLGYKLLEETPDYWSLKQEGLLKGKKIGLDASNLEANAAMRSIRRKIDGKRYTAYLQKLARDSGRQESSQENLARVDRNRPDKSCSNQDWENPNDPEARVTKMKDGSTHLAYKAEHGMDLETGAMVSAVIQPADKGDTETVWDTVAEAAENLQTVQEHCQAQEEILQELVADKGYHSSAVLVGLEEVGVRSYITGAMRRVWLRGLDNVWKRYLIHACAFNLALVMRKLYRAGTPRGLEALVRALLGCLFHLFSQFSLFVERRRLLLALATC